MNALKLIGPSAAIACAEARRQGVHGVKVPMP